MECSRQYSMYFSSGLLSVIILSISVSLQNVINDDTPNLLLSTSNRFCSARCTAACFKLANKGGLDIYDINLRLDYVTPYSRYTR